jgi:xyloglucan-specific exo-beta-1,4-glucanase
MNRTHLARSYFVVVCMFLSVFSGRANAYAPVPQANYQWGNVAIVAGGFVPGIEFSPLVPGLAYLRTDIGGAYRWDDFAQRWTPLLDWLSSADYNLMGAESIALDPVDGKRVYIAAGMYDGAWANDGAILSSTDAGKTWQRNNLPIKLGGNQAGRSMGERLAVDPGQHNVLFFGSRQDGLWRSADFGVTWAKVRSLTTPDDPTGIGISFVAFAPGSAPKGQPSRTIYIGVTNAATPIYSTTDGAETWQPVTGQPTGLMPQQARMDGRGVLYITYTDQPGPNGISNGAVYKYDTVAGVWTDISPVHPNTSGQSKFGFAGLAINPRHPGDILVTTLDRWSGGDDVFRSYDDGITWTSLKANSIRDFSRSPYLKFGNAAPSFGWWLGSVALDPFHPEHVLYGTGATVWSSWDANPTSATQATHWIVGGLGIEETSVLSLVSPPVGPHLISGLGDIGGFTHNDLTVSPPGGMSSNPIFTATTSIDFAGLAPNKVVRVGSGSGWGKPSGAYSNDGGETWSPFVSAPQDSHGQGNIAMSADGSSILWTPQHAGPSYSTDSGVTWTQSVGLSNNDVPVADRSAAHTFYAIDTAANAILTSTDGGATFTILSKLPAPGIQRLFTVPGETGSIWLSAGELGLYVSSDGGQTYAQVNKVTDADQLGFGKPAPGATYPAVFLAGRVGDIYGLFRSDDSGADWVRINDDQHQFGYNGEVICGDPRVYGRVYVATNGRGIILGEPADN